MQPIKFIKLKDFMETEPREIDEDLKYALDNNPITTKENIVDVLACVPGANDELSWHWIVRLKDGNHAYINAWCDYTGWDCQSGAFMIIAKDKEEVARKADDEYGDRKGKIAPTLLAQLSGVEPYGVITTNY